MYKLTINLCLLNVLCNEWGLMIRLIMNDLSAM